MREFNIARLMDSSPFIKHISDGTYDALFDYYNDCGFTLEQINVDNDIINGITESTIEEFNEYYESEEEVVILYKDDEEDIIAYWN